VTETPGRPRAPLQFQLSGELWKRIPDQNFTRKALLKLFDQITEPNSN